jgi:hypothetical protein
MSKLIRPIGVSQSYIVNYSGTGYLYFVYLGTASLKQVLDPNLYEIHSASYSQFSSFTSSVTTLSSPYTGHLLFIEQITFVDIQVETLNLTFNNDSII